MRRGKIDVFLVLSIYGIINESIPIRGNYYGGTETSSIISAR